MNTRAIENFILLPKTSGSRYFVFLGACGIFQNLFLKNVFLCRFSNEEKRSRSLTGEYFNLMLVFSLLFKA